MNMLRKYGFLLGVLALLLSACEKEIKLDLPDAETKVVVEGVIENGQHPYVVLTRSSSYFAPVNEWIDNLFIDDATVVVTDGTITDTLTLTLDYELFAPLPFLVYKSNNIVGEVGKTYDLTIVAEGQTLNASTTITTPVPLDSLWFQREPGAEADTLGYVWAQLSDPPELGNNYAWFSQQLGYDSRLLAPRGYTFDDKFFNGSTISFPYQRADDPLKDDAIEEQDSTVHGWFYSEGDTIVIKFCTMDYAHYKFRDILEDVAESGDNPFSSPATVPTNIKENGLGYWGGFGCALDTVVLIHQP